jgi:predicted HAD superfamily Cof-like phosphohydrolase
MLETEHYARVKYFMQQADQDCPNLPTKPIPAVAVLRARIILEEALETINGLGVEVRILDDHGDPDERGPQINDGNCWAEEFDFTVVREPDLVEIADGCADISVVTIGTLIACGIRDAPLLEMVDLNNLAKFGPGCTMDDGGKVVKPPGHKPPDIGKYIDWLLDGAPILAIPPEVDNPEAEEEEE